MSWIDAAGNIHSYDIKAEDTEKNTECSVMITTRSLSHSGLRVSHLHSKMDPLGG